MPPALPWLKKSKSFSDADFITSSRMLSRDGLAERDTRLSTGKLVVIKEGVGMNAGRVFPDSRNELLPFPAKLTSTDSTEPFREGDSSRL